MRCKITASFRATAAKVEFLAKGDLVLDELRLNDGSINVSNANAGK
jgi:hypothetical protein